MLFLSQLLAVWYGFERLNEVGEVAQDATDDGYGKLPAV
jgi:hypothetical protein